MEINESIKKEELSYKKILLPTTARGTVGWPVTRSDMLFAGIKEFVDETSFLLSGTRSLRNLSKFCNFSISTFRNIPYRELVM